MPYYPRVLVVTHYPFTWHWNNGQTLSSVFEGWPPDRLAQIYTPGLTPMPPSFDVCRKFWTLTPLGLRPGPAPASAAPAPAAAAPPLARRAGALRRTAIRATRPEWLQRATYLARTAAYARPGLLRGPAMEEVKRFAPELIFTTVTTVELLRVVLELSERLGAPVVPLVTDDWLRTIYRGALGERLLQREMDRAWGRVLERSPVRLAISAPMQEEYVRRYGGEWLAFTRCVDPAQFPATPLAGRRRAPVELVYAGQVAVNRWRILQALGRELLALREEGIEGRLTIYTTPLHVQQYGERLEMPPVVRVAGHVPADALPAIYDEADALVLVESFAPEDTEITAYSLSTKISEYLMAGRPVLGVGPRWQGSMRHIADSGGGVVIGEDTPEALRAGLRDLLGDAGARAAMGVRGRAFALEHHESAGQRERFRATLERAAARRAAAVA